MEDRRTKEKNHEKGVSDAHEQVRNGRFYDAKRLVGPCEREELLRERGELPKEEVDAVREYTGWLASRGPLSFLKPPFPSEWGLLGGPEDRNFDAGTSRDLDFDPFSWFEPPFGV